MNWCHSSPLRSIFGAINTTTQIFRITYEAKTPEHGRVKFVEKGKFSYFGLARNLIWHLISPNQDDLSYSARTFISGHQIL